MTKRIITVLLSFAIVLTLPVALNAQAENSEIGQSILNTMSLTAAASSVIEDGSYQIVTLLDDDYCLTVASELTTEGANIQLYSSRANAKHTFTITYLNDGYYSIKNVNSGKYIEVQNASVESGANVQQGNTTLNDAKRWTIIRNSDGSYSFKSKCGNNYLNVSGGTAANVTNINVTSGDNSKAQRFFLVEYNGKQTLEDGRYYISSALDSSEFITVASASTEDGANIRMYPTVGSPDQSWYVTYIANGYYSITNSKSGMGFDVDGRSGAPGANLHQWTYVGNNNQKWILKKNSDGTYRIICKTGGKAVAIEGGLAVSGANVFMAYPDNNGAQKWSFVPYTNGSGDGDDPIQSCNHSSTMIRNAKAAKYTAAGYTGDKYCTSCGALLQKGTIIAKKNASAVTPAKARLISAKASKKKVTLKWKRIAKNTKGYQIAIKNKKTNAIKYYTAKASKKAKISKKIKLKKGTYAVMLRAYNVVNGETIYGPWSNVKGGKVK